MLTHPLIELSPSWESENCAATQEIPRILWNPKVHYRGNMLGIFMDMLINHSWSWALLEKPPIVQLLKNFQEFYGTRRFITVSTKALHWSLSWARSIQSIPSHPLSLRSILILSTHLRLGLPSGLFQFGFPTNIPYAFLVSTFLLHAMPRSSSLTWSL
jgi:hypothetical protein